MRTMRIRQPYLNLIKEGKKTLEIRVGYDNIRKIKKGEPVNMISGTESQQICVRDIRIYKTFEEMLSNENSSLIAPGLTKEETLDAIREIYPPEKEELGVFVFDIMLS